MLPSEVTIATRRILAAVLPQQPDEHRPQRPVLLAVDQEFGERACRRFPSYTPTWYGTSPALATEPLYHHDPITDDRVRNDPLKIGHRGAPQCELHRETDPAVLRLALKAVERDGYWWVQCSACDTGWQVAHYAESVG